VGQAFSLSGILRRCQNKAIVVKILGGLNRLRRKAHKAFARVKSYKIDVPTSGGGAAIIDNLEAIGRAGY
jgi:hypothetical protein